MASTVRNSTILLLSSLFLMCIMNGKITLASGNGPWCILNLGVPEEAQQANIQYACGGGIADCSAMQPGGPCWSPDIGRMAAYAMNAYYFAAGHKDINCYFNGTGTIVTFDPSDAKCNYPS